MAYPRTAVKQKTEIITGSVDYFRQYNDSWGRLFLNGYDEPFVGTMPELAMGMQVTLEASFSQHPKYGAQYNVERVVDCSFVTRQDLVTYLSGPAFFGIGPKMAGAIVDQFGMQAIDIIDRDPEKLYEVKGIGKKRGHTIVREWTEHRTLHVMLTDLMKLGIPASAGRKIYTVFGDKACEIIKAQPYELMVVDGISFEIIDRVAHNCGIATDSPFRVGGAAVYCLRRALFEGHCYVTLSTLRSVVEEMLDVATDSPTFMTALRDCSPRETIYIEGNYVKLRWVHKCEERVAAKLCEIAGVRPLFSSRDEMLAVIEHHGLTGGIQLAPEQIDAIYNAVTYGLSVITGLPGTGKTTVTRVICALFEMHAKSVGLCAPTGRAAKRLSESTGLEAMTVHRFLDYHPHEGCRINHDEPLTEDVVLVDESSMLDIELTDWLLDAVNTRRQARVIFVGDKDQLPSVGPGNVLRDIIASGRFPVVKLTRIFRQMDGASIIEAAHKINRGEMVDLPAFDGHLEEGSCCIVEEPDPRRAGGLVKELVGERLPALGVNSDSIRLLSPMKKRLLGVGDLNPSIQQAVNPHSAGPGLEHRGVTFYPGDCVMQLRNDYDKGVFNGEIGYVTGVETDGKTKELEVAFPDLDEPVYYTGHELDALQLAYACTIHKSQGSEYPVVVLIMHGEHDIMLLRQILYTGLTRAKKACIIVGTKTAIAQAIRNDKESKRNTQLRDYINVIEDADQRQVA